MVDFDRIRKRLAVAEEKLRPSAERNQAVLHERARLLALEEARAREPAGEALGTIQLTIGGERFALSLEFVSEVLELESLTPLPGVPPFVRGIFAVRGEVFSAVDLAEFLRDPAVDRAPRGLMDLTRVVMVAHKKMELGLLCESSVGILDVPKTSFAARGGEIVLGKLADGTVVLDGARLLGSPRLPVGAAHGV